MDKKVIEVYKIVWASPGGDLRSSVADGMYGKRYGIGQRTYPVKGTSLFAFESFATAWNYMLRCLSSRRRYVIYDAIAEQAEQAPQKIAWSPSDTHSMKYTWASEDTEYGFDIVLQDPPRGTVFCDWIELVELIELVE